MEFKMARPPRVLLGLLLLLLGGFGCAAAAAPTSPPDEIVPDTWPESLVWPPLPTPTLPFLSLVTPPGAGRGLVLPLCAHAAAALPQPPQLPPGFLVPPGTLWTRAETSRTVSNRRALLGYTPLGLGEAAAFLIRELPRAGFSLPHGDQEAGEEIESTFEGKGWRGGFRLEAIPECPTATILALVVISPQ